MKFKSLSILFLIAVCFSVCSCSTSPNDKLTSKVSEYIVDKELSEADYIELKSFVQSHRDEYTDFVSGKNFDEKLYTFINDITKNRRDKPKVFNPLIVKNNNPVYVNYFVENSGSMDGYIKGNTEFEAALSNLIVQTEKYFNKENLKYNFINSEITEAPTSEFKTLIYNLEPDSKEFKSGNRGVSKFDEIIEKVVEKVDSNNISIFLSDCIYSLDKAKDTESNLNFLKYLIKSLFQEKLKKLDLSVAVFRNVSNFNGLYYDKNNKKTLLNDKKRPYFIWMIGYSGIVDTIFTKIQPDKLEGYQNFLFLSNRLTTPYYTILRETEKKGNFKINRDEKDQLISLEDVSNENKNLQFSFVADLSDIPVDENYILDSNNYILTDGFEIQSIEKFERDNIKQNDLSFLRNKKVNYLYRISNKQVQLNDSLRISLVNNLPKWVSKYSNIDDTNIKNTFEETFGIEFLLQGVFEAFSERLNQKNYFNLIFKIKRK